jgi:hypothetical protein
MPLGCGDGYVPYVDVVALRFASLALLLALLPPLGHASLTHSVTCTSPLFWAKLKLRLSPSQPLYDQGTIEEKEKDVEDSQDICRLVGIAPQTKEYLIASK